MIKAFEAKNVSITFGGEVKALSNVSLSADQGKVLAVKLKL